VSYDDLNGASVSTVRWVMAVSLNELRLAVIHRAGDENTVTLVDREEVTLSAAAEDSWSGAVFSFRVDGEGRTAFCFAWAMQVAEGKIEIPVIFQTRKIKTAIEAVRLAFPSGPPAPVSLSGREIM
jgi:hypothetical protein